MYSTFERTWVTNRPPDLQDPSGLIPWSNVFDWNVRAGTTLRISMSTVVTFSVRIGDGELGSTPLAETTPVIVATRRTIRIVALFLFKCSPPYHDPARRNKGPFLISLIRNSD